MEEERLRRSVREVVAHETGHDVSRVGLKDQLVADLDADSLDMVELVMSLETEFGITLDDTIITDAVTVEDVVRIVRNELEEA